MTDVMLIVSLLLVAILLVRVAWALHDTRKGIERIADELAALRRPEELD
jgi:hypothetical protein